MGWQDTKGQLLRALSPEGSAVGSDMQENPQKMGGMFMGMETWKGFPKNITPVPCCAEQPQHLLLALWSSVET